MSEQDKLAANAGKTVKDTPPAGGTPVDKSGDQASAPPAKGGQSKG